MTWISGVALYLVIGFVLALGATLLIRDGGERMPFSAGCRWCSGCW